MMSSIPKQLETLMGSVRKTGHLFQVAVAVLSAGALLALFPVTFHALSMTGADLARFEYWRLLTNLLVERNTLLLLWSVHCLWMACTIIEPIWGQLELIKFFAIVQVVSSLSLALVAMLIYITQKNHMIFFYAETSGAANVCGAVYVAMKQFVPDSILLTTSVGRVKNTHLPCCALLAVCVLTAVGAVRSMTVVQLVVGVQVAWTYLRFYQPHPQHDALGDPSEHFAWATLFPSRMQPLMAAFSGTVFALLLRLRVCKPIVRHVDMARLDSVSIMLPGLQTKDTERRRQKALRDLTERLSRSQRMETGAWPDMEDVPEDTHVQQPAQPSPNVPTHSVSEGTEALQETPCANLVDETSVE